MRYFSRIFLLCSFIYAFGVCLFIANTNAQQVKAETNHVVISQIQLNGVSANDEFVELYNPTNSPIDMSKWRLTRKSSTGGSVQNLVASFSGTIAPRGYYLVAHPAAPISASADQVYSSSSSAMTTNNTITLFSDAGITVVDKVGLGTAVDVETAAVPNNPDASESIIRKATQTSTPETLIAGGTEANLGNGYDTDNNSSDFVLLDAGQPRTSKSPQAQQPTNTPIPSGVPTPTTAPTLAPTVVPTAIPTLTPTMVPSATPTQTVPTNTPAPTATPVPTTVPTATPKPTSTPTPTSTPSPIPTSTPTPTKMPTPTPTTAPTATPIPTAVPTNTPMPTATITNVPTKTPTPLPTAVPTPTMTPTPTPSSQIIVDETLTPNRRLVCTQTFQIFTILGFKFSIPRIQCAIVRS